MNEVSDSVRFFWSEVYYDCPRCDVSDTDNPIVSCACGWEPNLSFDFSCADDDNLTNYDEKSLPMAH